MSNQSPFDLREAEDNFVKFSQFLERISEAEDVRRQVGQALIDFFDADLAGFLYRDEGGRWNAHYWNLPAEFRDENVFTPALRQTAAKVLESGKMACERMELDGPCQAALFPAPIDNQIKEIMLIGHRASGPIPERLLDIYLGISHLAGAAISRAGLLARLREQSKELGELQALVDSQTGSLADVNQSLEQVQKQISRELAQRQRAEQDLQNAEREKSAILNGLQEVEVLLLDTQLRIIWTNAGAALPQNRRDEDLRGHYCYKALQGRDTPCEGCTALAALRSKRFEEGEIFLPDGRSILARSNPLKNERGEISSVIQVGMDITRRKMVEQALIQREAQLRSIVENAVEIIYTLTPEGMICYASPRWTHLMGHEGPDLFGRSFVSFLHPADRAIFQSYFSDVAAGNLENRSIEFRLENREGQWRWYSTTLSVVKDKQGRLKEFVGIAEDISERKQAEEELRKAKEAAEAAIRAKNEFLTNMSHEIRTPMTSILGFAELLLENLKRPEDIVAANTIKCSGEYLLRLINDILDLSKIEAGRLSTEQARCSPRELIDEVVSMMKLRAAAKGLPLILEFAGRIPQTIRTDPIRLRQILVNLIGNAVKFTEEGHVHVVVGVVENEQGEPLLECKIADTGIGISREQIDALFEPFTQGNTTASRKHAGTGLGLALSKRLASMMGGNIALTSVPGQGSTFTATVATGPLEGVPMLEIGPIHEERPSPLEMDRPPATAKLSGHILLVEDGLDNQRLVSMILRKAGAEVSIAVNGKDALKKVDEAQKRILDEGLEIPPYAVILMDMQMPEMDGYEATWRLREMGYKAPIIALTAHAMFGDREKCLKAGCDEYLTKPIDREKLLSTIAQYLSSDESNQSSAEKKKPQNGVQSWSI
jgi:PAS domain S-box-containing protein